ncbi:MAG: aspartate kinase, partial [Spirochaetaceae bacterium]|nr:aspartate kinase [Spirochaetaceae bacterium]
GVTDSLVSAAAAAESSNSLYKNTIIDLKQKHHEAVKALISDNSIGVSLLIDIDTILDELAEILHGVELVKECSPRTNDLITGFGERLSSLLLAAHITDRGTRSEAVDAREIIRTDNSHGRASVDFTVSGELIRNRIIGSDSNQGVKNPIFVVTGFIASTAKGVATTLGRNGSDYTASILGAALDADAVEIWTDVDGILTADPRIVPDAWVIDEISFQEAMELSFFGAEVIHPYTLIPVIEKNLPVFIKNTLNPSAPGTRIAKTAAANNRPITGIASVDDISMITIEGGGMVGMPGIASRIFASMARTGANIIMITQASSEHSVCLVCRRKEAAIAAEGLELDLSDILHSGIIRSIRLTNGLEIVAVIGENMQGQLGLSGKLFSALGDAGVNILAIAQGSTELNISFVIKGEDKQTAIKAIHQTFFAHRQPEK